MTFKVTLPFTHLFSPPRLDPGFIHLADQLDQALLLARRRTGAIEHANHAASMLTGYSRAELARLRLAELVPAQDFLQPGTGTRPAQRGLPLTMLGVPLAARGGRKVLADIHVSFTGSGIDSFLLLLLRDSMLRLRGLEAASQSERSLQAMTALIALSVSPAETAIEQALRLANDYMGACGAGLYQVRSDQPGLTLVAGVGLSAAFPDQLAANEVALLLAPGTWTAGQRAQHALSQAARFAGWGTLLTNPIGENPGHLGVLFVGYRPEQNVPAPALLGVAGQQIYLMLRQAARHQALQHISAQHLAASAQLHSLLEQSRETVLILDADGHVQHLNPSARRLLGYELEEAAGMRFEDLLALSPEAAEDVRRVLQGDQPGADSSVTIRNRMGEAVPGVIRIVPLGEARGQASPSGAMILILDQSERVALEQRSLQLQQRALLGELSAILAHEVRNPINNISAIAQLMASRDPPDSPRQEELADIQAETRRLTRLVDDVLQTSRPAEIEFQAQSLGSLVERVLDRWAPRLGRARVTVRRELPPAPPVLIDTRSMERALTNLVDNAVHAMPEGGTLSVLLRVVDGGPRGSLVELIVADTGQGMDEETRARIFDPFFTTRASGTGLGMSITKHIIATVHKGSIGVESFPGTGTLFTILLPAALNGVHPQ